jgi:hypothetical protein
MIFNLAHRWVTKPHANVLWAYAIAPALIALPFIASFAGLFFAQRRVPSNKTLHARSEIPPDR